MKTIIKTNTVLYMELKKHSSFFILHSSFHLFNVQR